MAQPGTVMPAPRYCGYDQNGKPLAGGLLEVYAAGTSTPVTVYADAALSIPLSNPVVLDGSGRAAIFLAAGFFKFVQRTSLATGASIVWSQDNVSSTSPFAVDFDLEGTAGVAFTAGQVAYLSQGSGGLSPGQWYLADSDLVYASSGAETVGVAQSDVTIGATGNFRIQGRSLVPGPLTLGASYYVAPTAGALVTPAPTNKRLVGIADTANTIVTGTGFGARVLIGNTTIDGSLTVTSFLSATDAHFTGNLVVDGSLNVPGLIISPHHLTHEPGGVDTLQLSGPSKLFGRGSSGAGAIQEITLGDGLTMTGTVLTSPVTVATTPVWRQGQTWALVGDVSAFQYLPSIWIPIVGIQTARMVGLRTRLHGGTSVGVTLYQNGVAQTGAITVTTASVTTALSIMCANNDEIYLILSSPVGAPTNFSAMLILEYTL